jgi:hypothetical protein
MSAQTLLSSGDKWYSYSGSVIGDVSVPSSIQLNFIPNTGLRDSLVQITPFAGQPVTASANTGLGIEIKLDDVTIYKSQAERYWDFIDSPISLFIPRQSKLEIISLNTSGNNTQERGCALIGYYL